MIPMSDLHCSLCSHPFVFPCQPGEHVRCPSCKHMVTVVAARLPQELNLPLLAGMRRPLMAAAGAIAVALVVTAIYSAARQKTVFETSGLTPYSFIQDVWGFMAWAFLPSLALGVLTAIFGLLARRRFAPLAAGTFACVLLPLLGYQLFQHSRESGRSVQAEQFKIDDPSETPASPSAPEMLARLGETIQSILPDSKDKGPSKAEVEEASKGLVEDTQKFIASAINPDGSLKQNDLKFQPNANPQNQAEQLRAFTQTFFNDVSSQQKNYMDELDKAGISRLLDAKRISADPNFDESYTMLHRLGQVAKKHREKSEALIENFPDRVNGLNLDKATKEQIKKAFNTSLTTVRPQFKETWDLEEEILMQFRKIINHLQASRSRWQEQGGQFLFAEDADLARFNQYLEAVNKTVARQDAIRAANINKVQDKLKTLQ